MPNTKTKKVKKGKKVTALRALPRATFVPSSKTITMTYNSQLSITEGAAGLGGTYFYRLNSPYDPDASGVGASATGYSTWSALFLNYKVHRATARVRGVVTGMSTGFANVIIAPVPGQPVVPSGKQFWRSIRGNQLQTVVNMTAGGKNMANFTVTYDLAKAAGVTKEQYANDMDFSGTIASNPARQIWLLVATDSVNSSSVVTFTYDIDITYLVEWFNPIPMQ